MARTPEKSWQELWLVSEAGFSDQMNDLPWQFLRKGQTPGHGQRGITQIPENTEPWPQQKSE